MDEETLNMFRMDVLLPQLMAESDYDFYEGEFLERMATSQLLTEFNIHQFYAILIDEESVNVLKIIGETNLISKLWDFVCASQPFGLQLDFEIYQEIIEIVKTILSEDDLGDSEIDCCTDILQNIFSIMKEAYNQEGVDKTNNLFMECLGILYRKGRAIAEPLYAEMLARDVSCIEEFFQLFHNHLSLPPGGHERKVVQNLMKGLSIRLPAMMDNLDVWKLELLQAYKTLTRKNSLKIEFLNREPPSSYWLYYLPKQANPIILETLVQFCSKNTCHHNLASIIDVLIETYRVSSLKDNVKFSFMIDLFKEILSKSSLLFSLMSTSAISDDKEFLCWFIEHEIRMDNWEEVTQVYLGNKYALEFLVAMLIFYIHYNPQRKGQIKYLTDNFHLLEESKPFLTSETIRNLLRAYHDHIDDAERYQDFESSVLDAVTAFQI